MTTEPTVPEKSRRSFLAGVAGTAAVSTPAWAQPEFDGWFDDVSNYDGVADRTGEPEVTVAVGAQGNGGAFAFDPPAIRVDSGTTVVFEWASDTHNVTVASQPDGGDWAGHEAVEDEGFSFEHRFETRGVYKYVCTPHETLGMKGAVVVGDAGPGGESAGGGSAGGDGESADAAAEYLTLGLAGALVAGLLWLPVSETRRRDGQ
jgi:halocyanin-like protein